MLHQVTRFTMIPPAGVSIGAGILWKSLSSYLAKDGLRYEFEQAIGNYLKVKSCFLTSSGRSALALAIQVMKGTNARDEVLIPPYTCFSVPSAIARVGLKIRLCDINLDSLDFDISSLEKSMDEKVLCVIPADLFGLVSNLPEINRIAKRCGAFVINDAAQSFGASLDGTKCGMMGDVGILSLGRGFWFFF